MRARRGLLAIATLLTLAYLALPSIADRQLNRVKPPAHTPSARALALHQRLGVVDLHADSLLYRRDLAARSTVGHVDLPRLVAGRVAVQAFTIVTKVPRGLNLERNDGESDLVRALAVANRWPPRTWGSLLERALYQAEHLGELAADEHNHLAILRSRADLAALLARRKDDPTQLGALLGVEGAHALEGELRNLARLDAAGVRMIAPVHFFDNEWAGSAHGTHKSGLTPAGRQLIAELERRKILVDLAHASPKTIADVLAIATRPVVVSHTGIAATCPGPRNLTDEQLRAIAKNGGLVGIAYFEAAVCGLDPALIARAIAHTISVAGIDHVALGSDFDGAVTTAFDAAGLAYVTDALLAAGLDERTIRKVMGGNALAFLAANLP